MLRWFILRPASPLVERTIQEARIRTRTGASAVAVLRDEALRVNPAPDFRFAVGDRIALLTDQEQWAAFEGLCLAVPDVVEESQ